MTDIDKLRDTILRRHVSHAHNSAMAAKDGNPLRYDNTGFEATTAALEIALAVREVGAEIVNAIAQASEPSSEGQEPGDPARPEDRKGMWERFGEGEE